MKTAGKHNSNLNRARSEKKYWAGNHSLRAEKKAAHKEARHAARLELRDHYGIWEDWDA